MVLPRIDPWVRLHALELMALRPRHLYSSFDNDVAEEFGLRSPARAGVTEWVADGHRQISFGWDWYWDPRTRLMLADWRQLRTNALIVDDLGRDQPGEQLCPHVEQLMAETQWQAVVGQALGL